MPKTNYFTVDKNNPDIDVLKKASLILRKGGLVAFPTETVYGLGANAFNEKALGKIYEAKGRPRDNPLILHISMADELEYIASGVTGAGKKLIEAYWPGPLTLVLRKKECVSEFVTGGLDTVAVRTPDSLVARKLISLCEFPLAAPSANTSGRPSPTNARAVFDDLNGKIDAILDAGDCAIGVESTVVDLTGEVPLILRPGAITYEMLELALGRINIDDALKNEERRPKSPGMKYNHYAPKYPMCLVENGPYQREILQREINKALLEQKKVGAVISEETALVLPMEAVKSVYGPKEDMKKIAASLYEALRFFDREKVDIIFAEGTNESGLGLAVMNRLRKAAARSLAQ